MVQHVQLFRGLGLKACKYWGFAGAVLLFKEYKAKTPLGHKNPIYAVDNSVDVVWNLKNGVFNPNDVVL